MELEGMIGFDLGPQAERAVAIRMPKPHEQNSDLDKVHSFGWRLTIGSIQIIHFLSKYIWCLLGCCGEFQRNYYSRKTNIIFLNKC
jgi:hypothetical protein